MKAKIRLTRCYLIQIVDDEGNELEAVYEVCGREDAVKLAKEMQKSIQEELDREADEEE